MCLVSLWWGAGFPMRLLQITQDWQPCVFACGASQCHATSNRAPRLPPYRWASQLFGGLSLGLACTRSCHPHKKCKQPGDAEGDSLRAHSAEFEGPWRWARRCRTGRERREMPISSTFCCSRVCGLPTSAALLIANRLTPIACLLSRCQSLACQPCSLGSLEAAGAPC